MESIRSLSSSNLGHLLLCVFSVIGLSGCKSVDVADANTQQMAVRERNVATPLALAEVRVAPTPPDLGSNLSELTARYGLFSGDGKVKIHIQNALSERRAFTIIVGFDDSNSAFMVTYCASETAGKMSKELIDFLFQKNSDGHRWLPEKNEAGFSVRERDDGRAKAAYKDERLIQFGLIQK